MSELGVVTAALFGYGLLGTPGGVLLAYNKRLAVGAFLTVLVGSTALSAYQAATGVPGAATYSTAELLAAVAGSVGALLGVFVGYSLGPILFESKRSVRGGPR